MLLTSPLITALNQTLHWLPICTSPTIVAFGAMKQSTPQVGAFPSTGTIKAMGYNYTQIYEFICASSSLLTSKITGRGLRTNHTDLIKSIGTSCVGINGHEVLLPV
jgi:hypothetical protein